MAANKRYRILRWISAACFFFIFIASFTGLCRFCALAMHIEFVPAVLRWMTGVSAGAVAVTFFHFLLARCAGRVYCSILCPLGIMQDIAGLIPLAKNRPRRDFVPLRFGICGVVSGILVSGSAAGFYWLDPYTLAGRSIAALLLGGTLPVALILLATFWRRRAFCTYICPAGTFLGLLSRSGVWQLEISESCVNCKKCVKACPAGCIDIEQKNIDNERCLRCMQCVSACPVKAVSPVRKQEKTAISRREFLKRSLWAGAGLIAGMVITRTGLWKKLFVPAPDDLIYPPGAADRESFLRKCTGCLLCVKACPQKIIVPDKHGAGTVRLKLDGSFCSYDCNRCGDICPTGAIRPLPLNVKRRVAIAKAKFDPTVCLVYQEGEQCGKCARACPAGAITLRRGAPSFKANLCIGCGACRTACPTEAFSITPLREQQPLDIQATENKKG